VTGSLTGHGTAARVPQWSRDPRVAVTTVRGTPAGGREGAAMEPRPEGRGDAASRMPWAMPSVPQWSRDPRVAVTRRSTYLTVTACWPQWSRDPRVAVTRHHHPRRRHQQGAAMEPRPEGRGDDAFGVMEESVGRAAMEPRPEGRGDRAAAPAPPSPSRAAMEPRPEGRGDEPHTDGPACLSPVPQWSRDPRVAVTAHCRECGK